MTWTNRRLLCVAALWGVATSSSAQSVLTADRSGSLLVFPKVIASASSDTMIEITNTASGVAYLSCFYVDGMAPRTRTAFTLSLTRLQPTHWVVSKGRGVDASDAPCSATSTACHNAGKDPGNIPARPNFRGELICAEAAVTGELTFGNHFGGQATLRDLSNGDVSQYRALSAEGDPDFAAATSLCLGCEGQLSACPRRWMFNHLSDNTTPMPEGEPASDEMELVVARCSQNLATLNLGASFALYTITNELEQRFSNGFVVPGWTTFTFDSVGLNRAALGTLYVQTEISNNSPSEGGFFVVAQQRRTTGGVNSHSASAGISAQHSDIAAAATDMIVVPDSAGGAGQ